MQYRGNGACRTVRPSGPLHSTDHLATVTAAPEWDTGVPYCAEYKSKHVDVPR